MTRVATGQRGRLIVLASSQVLLLVEAAVIVLLIFHGVRWSLRPDKGLLDFGSFIASGDVANKGLNPYGVYDLTFRVGTVPAPNLNPPISVYPFQLAARFDPTAAYHVWYALSLGMVIVAFGLLWRAYPKERVPEALWAFALGGLWHTLELGQIYAPLLLAATVGWLLLRDRDDWRAGIAIGLVAAIKPQFLAWPALLLLGRNWRSAVAGFATFGLLWAIPLALDGRGIYEQWSAATPPVLEPNLLAGNSSLLAVGGRLGVPDLFIALNLVLGLAVAAAVAWRRPSRMTISAAAIVLALLTGPITWPGYTILLLPVLFAVGWRRALPAVLLLAFPYSEVIQLVAPGSSGTAQFLAGSVYFFGLVALATLVAWSWWASRNVPSDTRGPRHSRSAPATPPT